MSSTRASARPNPNGEGGALKFGQQQPLVYVYYSPRLNTPVDVPGTGINEGDAPTGETPQTGSDQVILRPNP